MRPDAKSLLSGHEGSLVPMLLSSGREIIVAVPTSESEARAAGHDVYFQTCTEQSWFPVINHLPDGLNAMLRIGSREGKMRIGSL